jgi:threonine aldolase
MIFSSDNWAGVHSKVAEALTKASGGFDSAYGSGEWDKRVAAASTRFLSARWRCFLSLLVLPPTRWRLPQCSGQAAWCLAILKRTFWKMNAARRSIFRVAADFMLCPDPLGKIDPTALEAAIGRFPPAFIHHGQPAAISITQATEIGTVYSTQEIGAIAEIGKRHGIPLHMDGARFANGQLCPLAQRLPK